MGIREKLNENKGLTIGVFGVLIVGVVAWVIYNSTSNSSSDALPAKNCYYTEDDGKTFFADSWDKLGTDFKGPNGGASVRAYVVQYIGENERQVGWLEKYTPKGAQMLRDYYGKPANKQSSSPYEVMREALVKRPGAKQWIGATAEAAMQVRLLEEKNGNRPNVVAP